MLWKTQPDDELEDKGLDENHSQSKHSILNHIFTNNRHYQDVTEFVVKIKDMS